MTLDERAFSDRLRQDNQRTFLKMIDDYEKSVAPSLRAQGFKRINQKERTVIFSFGEMTFSRSRWKRGNEIRIPVDEKLGIEPRARFSQELLYQVTSLATVMPYRKVVEVMKLLKAIYITKNTVQHALDLTEKLIKEKEEYDSLSAGVKVKAKDRIKVKTLYVEGDGLWVKQASTKKQTKSVEISHFVVHTGSKKGKRNVLQNKFEVVATRRRSAKEKVLDLITNYFEITPDTVIVTNSDGGAGYSPSDFKELASSFTPKKHVHFWDSFHVNESIKKNLRQFPKELTTQAFEAIKERDKKQLRTVLDTVESLIESEDKLASFRLFRRRMIRGFKYTEKPESFGLDSGGIGIIESQHRKITYRMKNRGMYWSEKGAGAISQAILLNYTGELRDLFFGEWRKNYKFIQKIDNSFIGNFMKRQISYDNQKSRYTLPASKRRIARRRCLGLRDAAN